MRKIEFVSYDGKYPNLCSGTLILSVDGKEYSWRGPCLVSGGEIIHDGNWNDIEVITGPWGVDFDMSPDQYDLNFTDEEMKFIVDLVNDNVDDYGCCGGCI